MKQNTKKILSVCAVMVGRISRHFYSACAQHQNTINGCDNEDAHFCIEHNNIVGQKLCSAQLILNFQAGKIDFTIHFTQRTIKQ